jgi:hypothetical protein
MRFAKQQWVTLGVNNDSSHDEVFGPLKLLQLLFSKCFYLIRSSHFRSYMEWHRDLMD